jgi:hypothetical protein
VWRRGKNSVHVSCWIWRVFYITFVPSLLNIARYWFVYSCVETVKQVGLEVDLYSGASPVRFPAVTPATLTEGLSGFPQYLGKVGIVPRLGQNLSLPNSLSSDAGYWQRHCSYGSWVSSVGVTTGWRAGVRFPAGARDFSLLHSVRSVAGPTQAPIQWERRTLSSGVKRPGRDGDHLPMSSAEIENSWSYTSTPFICLHGL